MAGSRFIPLGPLDSSPGSRAFLGYEAGPNGPLWPIVLVWVPEEIEEDVDRMAQLRDDTERAAQIDSPHVIRVIGCEKLDEGFARVVEYGDAESLRRFLGAAAEAKQPLPTGFLLRVVADAAAGVHHVHEMGQAEGNLRRRLHSGLRPETLLVGFDGTTKVTGYGAVAVAPRDVFGARLSPRLQYLSPEELEGGPIAADRRSDVYGLALILYDALSGRLPYLIGDPDFEQQVLAGVPPLEPLTALPPLLREVIIKGLARNPDDRFATAALFRQALESLGPWTPAEVAQLCSRLIPEAGPERSGRAQLLRELGFPPGPLPRPAIRLQPKVRKPVEAAARPPPATPPAVLGVIGRSPASKPPLRPQERPPVNVAPAPPPPRLGPPLGAVVLGGVGIALLLVATLFLARPDLWHALITGMPVEVQAPATARLKANPIMAPPETPEPPPIPPPGPAPAVLELSSDPPLKVSVDGKAQGTTPLSIEVPAGDHTVRFRDPLNGIDIERRIFAKEGVHHRVPVHVSHASMEVTAPKGSEVFLDGKFKWHAPLPALKFFEGHHDIKVKMGKSTFDRQFTAEAGEDLTLDVRPTAE
jgi:eukaryotic-like serine/threonine-protein kinase